MQSSSSAIAGSQPNKPKKAVGVSLPFTAKNTMVLVGSYHSVLAALVLRGAKFLLKFSVKRHVGCINAVAASDKYLATTGTDEKIFLFTNRNKGAQCADLGSLAPAHEVRMMAFAPGGHFLVCGCENGTLVAYRTRDWEQVIELPLHGKSIEGMDFHPGAGGRIGVTVGMDRFVCMLDMTNGKVITKFKIPVAGVMPRGIRFSTSLIGSAHVGAILSKSASNPNWAQSHPHDLNPRFFFVMLPFTVLVYDTMTAQLVARLEQPERQPADEIHALCSLDDGSVILIGCEDGSLRVAVLPNRGADLVPVVASEEDASAAVAAPNAAAAGKHQQKHPLASLDKSKVATNNNKGQNQKAGQKRPRADAVKEVSSDDSNDDDDAEEEDEERELEEDAEDDSSDDDDNQKKNQKKNSNNKLNKKKGPAPADAGRVAKLSDAEGPYLKVSKKQLAEDSAKEARSKQNREVKAEQEAAFQRDIPVFFFGTGGIRKSTSNDAPANIITKAYTGTEAADLMAAINTATDDNVGSSSPSAAAAALLLSNGVGGAVPTYGIPAEVEQSQAHIPKQSKRKYPTKHEARIRQIIISEDGFSNRRSAAATSTSSSSKKNSSKNNGSGEDEKAIVLITIDTDGCVIAWRFEYLHTTTTAAAPAPAVDMMTSVQGLSYLASANCSGRVTSAICMQQE